ncbi:hypothetical protein [Chryseobacterium sp. Leaf394]|uniref:hypothetical protein n=1 Tax=Chryseobacterium sp. Leaf394 TaxID=1736361 RepID=UPI0006F51C1D|nr:hypothetical protein [Chryseobacterium sp. Leaf394]KQS93750.1 hypothetical protein ASG21_01345 [Chryseobacterium sp. Leaf394]
MKKLFPIFIFALLSFFVVSCDNNDDVVVQPSEDTYAVAFDLSPTFTRVNSNLYEFNRAFDGPLVESDVVLIYMQTGLTNNGSPIWKLLPYTFYTNNANNDVVDYGFDFSKFDISITVSGTLNLDSNASFYAGTKYRVVLVPAKTGKGTNVDYNDYNSVIKFYNIDESKISLKK